MNLEDTDSDGFSTCDGDCDDANATAFPGAGFMETGDFISTLEDGIEISTPLSDLCLLDADLDGYGDIYVSGTIFAGTDCDDNAFDIFPGSAELDSEDECLLDADNDGFAPVSDGGTDCDDSDDTLNNADADGDGQSTCDGDCDDGNQFVSLGNAVEDPDVLFH